MRIITAVCCVVLVATVAFAQCGIPKNDYVPDSSTAIKIAEAVLLPIFGEEHIKSAKPFSADLTGDVWDVYEEACKKDGKGEIVTCQNAGLQVQLSKIDGHTISVSHFLKDDGRKDHYVPDSGTATRIGEAVLLPVYGEKVIGDERPLTATIKGDVWTVSGTLNCPGAKSSTTAMCDGGVAEVHISKADARILYMCHGK
jgi:hypothetical protein